MNYKVKRKSTVRIPSRLYNALFQRGGDRLVAFYCLLRAYKGRMEYFKIGIGRNGKVVKNEHLLHYITGMTRETILKYSKMLVKEGVMSFSIRGDVMLLGTRKLNNIYRSETGKLKIIPIVIDENLTKTAYNSKYVRLHSAHRAQRQQITKKNHRHELLKQMEKMKKGKNVSLSSREYKEGQKLLNKYGSADNYAKKEQLNKKITLSQHKTGKILAPTCGNPTSAGEYYRSQMRKKNKIVTFRSFEFVKTISSVWEYYMMKEHMEESHKLTRRGNKVYREKSSVFFCKKLEKIESEEITLDFTFLPGENPTYLKDPRPSLKKQKNISPITNLTKLPSACFSCMDEKEIL